MNLLFDTHTFIWWDGEPSRLSTKVLALCNDPNNRLLLSVVSLWEIQIKSQLGKLKLRVPLSQIVAGQQQANQIQVLSVNLEHVLEVDQLPLHHKDPFDRLLIAQARIEGVTLMSKDAVFGSYEVNLVW